MHPCGGIMYLNYLTVQVRFRSEGFVLILSMSETCMGFVFMC